MNPQANRQQGLDPSRGDSSRESTSTRAVATNNVDVATRKEIEADASSSDASEEEPNFDHLPQLKRPRKKAYKSTLCKRDREKKRRDHFNEGLQQLAELVFQVDPSISSGREDHIVHDGKSTTITNRGDLMYSAVDVMTGLMREHAEQKAAIAKLTEALADANAKCELLLERSKNLARVPPNAGLSTDTLAGLHDLGLIDPAALARFQRLASSNPGLPQQGEVGFNPPLNRSSTGLPPRRRLLDELLSVKSSGGIHPDSSFAASFLGKGGGGLDRPAPFMAQQQRPSVFPNISAEAISSAVGPNFDMRMPDPSGAVVLQHLLRVEGRTDHSDSLAAAALAQREEFSSSTNKKK